jgi:DNA modification methylase
MTKTEENLEGAGGQSIEQVQTETLIPYARNSRTHSDEQVAQIMASIREFGFCNPVLIDAAGTIIAGHGRVMAATRMKLETVPCLRLSHLTEAQRRAYVIADNRIALSSSWDSELLSNELSDLHADDFDLGLLGFDPDELAALLDFEQLPGDENAGEVVEDEVPEPPVDPITKPGDLWILGEHRLLCGDSTKADDVARLMAGAKADMMFTDPPYGVNYEGGHFHSGDVSIKNKREKLASDSTTAIYPAFLPVALSVVDGPCYMWFADSKARDVYNSVFDNHCEVHALIIWHKTNATYAAMNAQYKQRHEPCLYFKPKGSTLRWCGATTEATIWSQDRDGINEFHPTQKPVALAGKAIKNHEAKTVVDMFCGSGSTLIAAEQLNRKCYGMEISPAYCDVIVKRWENLTGKVATLETNQGE